MLKGFSLRCLPASRAAAYTALILMAAATMAAQKPEPLYGVSGVTAVAVRQGYLGSCYFHAALSALANANPDAIRNAIHQDEAGNYRVRFFEGAEETVYLDDVTFAETHKFDRSDGEWVRVLMRAYAQRLLRQSLSQSIEKSENIPTMLKPAMHQALEGSDVVLQAYDRAIRSVISQNGAIDKGALKARLNEEARSLGVPLSTAGIVTGFLDEKGVFEEVAETIKQNGELFGAYRSFGQGGIPSRVFQAFVGAGHTDFPSHRDRILTALQRLKSGGVAMVADSIAAEPADSHTWWIGEHAYTVLGFDDATQTVTLRNPWGEHPDPDGVFRLPFAVFLQDFNIYSLSTPEAR
jgi:hypothetical protein